MSLWESLKQEDKGVCYHHLPKLSLLQLWNIPIDPPGDRASLKGGGSQATCSGCPGNDWPVGCLWVPFPAPVCSLVLLVIENTVRNKALAVFPGSTSACLPPGLPPPTPTCRDRSRQGRALQTGMEAFICSLAPTLFIGGGSSLGEERTRGFLCILLGRQEGQRAELTVGSTVLFWAVTSCLVTLTL